MMDDDFFLYTPIIVKIIRELFCAVLCMTVVHNDTHTHEQFLQDEC